MVGCLRAGRLFPDETANPKILTPVGRRPARVEAPFARFEALLGFSQASGADERFTSGEVGLNQVALRDARSLRERVSHADRFIECLSARGQLDSEYFQRPLVPPHGLSAVRTVRLACEPQILFGAFV